MQKAKKQRVIVIVIVEDILSQYLSGDDISIAAEEIVSAMSQVLEIRNKLQELSK